MNDSRILSKQSVVFFFIKTVFQTQMSHENTFRKQFLVEYIQQMLTNNMKMGLKWLLKYNL